MADRSPTHAADQPFLGILLMLGFCALAPMGDAIVKVLGERVPLYWVLVIRFAVQGGVLAVLVALTGRDWRLRGRVLWLAWIRAALHIAGIAAIFVALRYLPIAEAIAIAFVMPFLMLVLGKTFLNEVIGARRLWACVVGFAGTLMVVQPTFADAGWPALLPLLVAVVFALFMLVTRMIARDIDPVSLQAVNGGMALILLVPFALLMPGLTDVPVAITTIDWVLLFSIGMLGTLAHLMMTWSLKFAPAATLAPMQYLEIPIATFYGWFIFAEYPDGLAAMGICVTIGAGLFIVLTERTMSRVPPIEQP